MRILGIDPGTATVGFGIIEFTSHHLRVLDFGHISTLKTTPRAERLTEIAHDLKELCKKWKPEACAVEELFFNKNITNAMKVSEARGVILHTLDHGGYPIFEYNPVQIKVAVTGDGKADKIQMQKMVRILLNLSHIPKPDDAADALAVALCHAHTSKNLKSLTLTV